MTGGSGSSGAAKEQRQLEEQRQRQIQEAVNRVNATFDGGTYGTGAVDPTAVKWDQAYYDSQGKPITYAKPAPTAPAGLARRSTGIGPRTRTTGNGTGTMPVEQPAPAAERVAAGPFVGGGMAPPATGVYSSTVTGEGFGDGFYDSVAKGYEDYYRPLVKEQYKRTRRDLMVGSATGGSSAHLRDLGDLDRDYQREQVNVQARGSRAATDARTNVERTRSDLLNAAQAGAAPDTVAMQAAEARKSLAAPAAYDPVGDLFGRYATTLVNRRQAQMAGYNPGGTPSFNFRPQSSVTNVK